MSALSLNWNELTQLPNDVLCAHIIPLLAAHQRVETADQAFDRWASQYAKWWAQHQHMMMKNVPGFRPHAGKYMHTWVRDQPLISFFTLGAEEMPLSVYVRFCSSEEGEESDPVHSYLYNMHVRMVFRGEIEHQATEVDENPWEPHDDEEDMEEQGEQE